MRRGPRPSPECPGCREGHRRSDRHVDSILPWTVGVTTDMPIPLGERDVTDAQPKPFDLEHFDLRRETASSDPEHWGLELRLRQLSESPARSMRRRNSTSLTYDSSSVRSCSRKRPDHQNAMIRPTAAQLDRCTASTCIPNYRKSDYMRTDGWRRGRILDARPIPTALHRRRRER